MTAGRFCKLIKVSVSDNPKKGEATQSNKYYQMTEKNGQIEVEYGRVESTKTIHHYSIYEWDKLYNAKVKKGYKDVTHTVAVEVVTSEKGTVEYATIKEATVNNFLTLMKRYTDNLVKSTYSVKATSVTQAQVDEAQAILDNLKKIDKKNQKEFNAKLIELYTIIPRQMRHVQHHLLPSINVDKTLDQEQDNLDAMASQVAMLNPKTSKKQEDKKKAETLIDALGISITEIDKNESDLAYLLKQNFSQYCKVKTVFKVNKPKEDVIFENWLKSQKNKQTKILIHGTRCTSVIPILEQGLKIRPTGNYQFSGKAYGDGNYFSEVMQKSLGYTGRNSDKVILVYEVHTGNPFTYDGWYRGNSFSLNYKELSSRGYDSTYVKAGGGLLNSEIIAYREEQCRIKYIIHLTN